MKSDILLLVETLNSSKRIAQLIFKDLTDEISVEEAIELKRIIESSEDIRKLYEELNDPDLLAEDVKRMASFDPKASLEKIKRAVKGLER